MLAGLIECFQSAVVYLAVLFEYTPKSNREQQTSHILYLYVVPLDPCKKYMYGNMDAL